jgi:hypothetical protein
MRPSLLRDAVRTRTAVLAATVASLSCSRSVGSTDADRVTGTPPSSTGEEPAPTDDGGRTSPDPSQVGAAWPAATVSVLDLGRPPRHKLRYSWRVDRREELTMDLRTVASTDVGDAHAADIALPPVRIVVAIDPSGVSPEGDLRFDWHVVSTDVGADPRVPSQLAGGMRDEVAAITHLAGTGVGTARGLAEAITIDPGTATMGESNGQMIEQVRQTLRDVAVPFPETDVGLGARWQKVSQLASKEARITQSDTFRLRSFAGRTGAVDDALAQTAPPQALRATGMPAGALAQMESMLASGTAKMVFDETRLVAQTTIESTTTMIVSGHSEGDPARRMTMILRVEITLTGSVR